MSESEVWLCYSKLLSDLNEVPELLPGIRNDKHFNDDDDLVTDPCQYMAYSRQLL